MTWALRPTVWFATASIVTTILHELTHATVAYALGVRSTLHNYSVDLDLTPEQAVTDIPAIIGVAGPLFCLGLGIVAWVALKYVGRGVSAAAELPLLYFAVFGVGTFFGNLVSASFIGDFSRAAIALHLPMPARYALSLAGITCVAVIHFRVGRELTRWVPPTMGRFSGMLGIIAVPVILGTAIVILANVPTANSPARAAEALFWVFSAIGALVPGAAGVEGAAKAKPYTGADQIRLADVGILLVAILIVRLLVRGIPFVP